MFRLFNKHVIVVLCVVVAAACSRDPESAKQEYLRSGDKLLADKNFQGAIVEYRNAIKQDARFGLARYKLAQAHAAMQNWPRARAEFIRAADLLPQDVEVQVAAAESLLRSGEFQDARTRAEAALKLDPKNARAHLVRGSAAAGLRDFDGALKEFEEGLVADPKNSQIRVTMGILQTFQGNQAEAEASFKEAVAVDPQSVDARLALANYFWWAGRVPDAEQAIQDAVRIDPNGFTANRALAMFYIAINRASDAEAPLRRAAETTEDAEPSLILADYYVAQKRHAEALAILDKVATRPGAFAPATVRRAGIAYQLGRRDEAYATLEQIIAKEPKNVQVQVVKGGWLLGERKLDAALATAQIAIKADPEAWTAYDLLGSVQAARRQTDDAVKAFLEVLRLNPQALNAQVRLSELNLVQRKYDSAVRFADEALQSRPDSGLARLALVRALLGSGSAADIKRARAELQPVVNGSPNVAPVQVLLGHLEMREGNLPAARRAFERAEQIDPTSSDAVAGLVRLDTASKQIAQAVKRVEGYVANTPDNPEGYYLAALTYAQAGRLTDAESSVKKVLELDASHMNAYNLLAGLYIKQQKLDEARHEYERIVQQRPNDLPANTMIALLLQAQQKLPEAKKAYEKILTLNPNAVVAANNLAYIHAEEGTSLDVALNLAQTAKAGLPDDADVNDTLGWVYYKRGLAEMAIDPLEQSVKTNPTNALTYYHLGLAYLKLGDRTKARTALERALALQPNFDGALEARKALANLKG